MEADRVWSVTRALMTRLLQLRRAGLREELPVRPLAEVVALARVLEPMVPAEQIAAASRALAERAWQLPAEEFDVACGYAAWVESYDAGPNPLILVEEPTTLSLLGNVAGKDVLDAACGTGRYTVQLAQAGARVCGLDASLEMLAQAERKCLEAGAAAALQAGDLNALPYPAASFDLVLCALALCHVPSLDQAVAELARVLRPGGRLVISDFHPFGLLVGWRTRFAKDGRHCLIQNEVHLVSDLLRGLRRAGMAVEEVREEVVDDRLLPMLGEEGVAPYRGLPLALIISATKETHP